EEGLGGGPAERLVVEDDLVDVVGDRPGDDDDAAAPAGAALQGGGVARRGKDDARHALVLRHGEVAALHRDVVVGVARDDREARHAARDGGEGGVRDVGDHQGDGLAVLAAQRTGGAVGDVGQVVDGSPHGVLEVGSHAGAVEDAGDGRGGHAGAGGDVDDPRH